MLVRSEREHGYVRHRGIAYLGSILERLLPDDIRRMVEYAAHNRPPEKGPLEIVVGGSTGGKKAKRPSDIVKPCAEAGATWWVESDPALARIRQGPPV